MIRRALYTLPFILLAGACSSEKDTAPTPQASGFQSGGSGGINGGAGAGTNQGGKSGNTAGASAGTGGGNAAGTGNNAAGTGNPAAGAGGTEAAGSGGADPGPGCAIPPKPGEFYELEAQSLEQLDPIPMCTYQGKVVLIVNVASKCGYTPQYAPLQQLFDKYKAQGFEILGFPCSQFSNQEFEDDADISQFCTEKYGINFPMFTKIDVNGPEQHPVYSWLKSQPGGEGDIPWNFTKFLLGRDGKLIKRITTQTSPDAPEVLKLIEEALAAPAP